MTCRECRTYQLVAVLEPEKLAPAAGEAMLEHQLACAACQDSAERLQRVLEAMSPVKIPREVLDRVHDNVMRRIREERPSRNLGALVLSFGAAAAAAVLCISTWRMVSRPERPLPPVAQRPDPVPAALRPPSVATAPPAASTLNHARSGLDNGEQLRRPRAGRKCNWRLLRAGIVR